jgi:hypothetical protein
MMQVEDAALMHTCTVPVNNEYWQVCWWAMSVVNADHMIR